YVQTIGTLNYHIYGTRNQNLQLEWDSSYVDACQKKLRTDFIVGLVWAIIGIVLLGWLILWRDGGYFLLNCVENSGEKELFYASMLLFAIYNWNREAAGQSRLYRRLKGIESGEENYEYDSYNNFEGYPWFPYGLRQIMLVAMSVILVIVGFVEVKESRNFDDCQPELACVDLRTLEEEGFEITQITWDDNPGLNFGNRILEKFGLFTEYFYEVDQYGTDANGERVQIFGCYYKVRPDGLAVELLEQLIDRSTSYMYEHQYGDKDKKLPPDYWSITELENTGFTKLVVAEALAEKAPLMIFAQKEDVVIYLRYSGSLPAERFIGELEHLYSE
ncbi:MAG: hypothetical protein IKU69_07185, partial [Roseburia sp.]|nr:hypothetical protein [Roseburia sp.]